MIDLPAWFRLAAPAGALCACALIDPDRPPNWIVCPFRLLTGLPCPTCGMTRAVASILRARWADAVAFHPLSPLVFAGLAGWLLAELGHRFRWWDASPLHRLAARPSPWLAFLAVSTAFGALRWLGWTGAVQ